MEESSHFGMAVLLIYRNLSKISRNKFWVCTVFMIL